MLRNFQSTLMKISAAVAALVMALSYLLSRMLTRRISDLLQAIRKVREGAYSHRRRPCAAATRSPRLRRSSTA